jgi:hypothetical protein
MAPVQSPHKGDIMTLKQMIDELNKLSLENGENTEIILDIEVPSTRFELEIEDILINLYVNGEQKIALCGSLEVI